LVESGHVLDVEIRVLPTEFAAPWYGVPVDREDARQLNFVRLVQEMAEDSARNWAAVRTIREEVAAGEQVLVMCHEREHCMKVGQMLVGYGIPSGYLLGGPESAKEFATSIAGLKSGALRVGVGTYKAIGTGIDIPRVGVAVAMTPIGGNQQNFGQVRGRVCRTAEGKTIARLYLLWDRCVYPSHLKNFVAWNTDVSVREESGNWLPAKTYIRDDR
jgi:superfamily II DNA or RNA helicase